MLSDDARKVIAGQSEEYTWTEENGLDEEMDDMTILALILWCLRPHYKVDMYSEIGAIKQMTIVQYDEDINLFFDSIKSVKLQIDSKDPVVRSHHLVLRLGVDVHHARVAVGNSLAIRILGKRVCIF